MNVNVPKTNSVFWVFHVAIEKQINRVYEIPIPTCRDQPKIIMWVFHLAVKKQNINK